MGVIYKILKQHRHQQQQQQQQQQKQQQPQRSINMDLNTATKCKVQAAIKQRQLQRLEERHQDRQEQQEQRVEQDGEDTVAEHQLQQLCRFLAENAARKKRQRLKLLHQYNRPADAEQPLSELQSQSQSPSAATTHDMDLLMEQLTTCTEAICPATTTATLAASGAPGASGAPRDSILLKIRHQIFERKRQRQRQLAELVKQRLVVWRPW